MQRNEWIDERIDKLKGSFGDRLKDYEFVWVAEMLESAWELGIIEGRKEALRGQETK